jgi:hypothetical protein
MDLTMNEDNTIQKIALTSESRGAAGITAAGAQLSALATGEATRAKTSAASQTAEVGLGISADKAKQAADLAALQAQLVHANGKSTPEEILKADQKERSAKLDANEAARLARRAPYFPDVFP